MNIWKKLGIAAAGVILAFAIHPVTAFAATSYKVVPNDSLYTLSGLFKTTVSKIMMDNLMTNDYLYVGQTLKVPAVTYTVQSGDTLFSVARAKSIPLNSLRKANGKWDNLIIPGQKLILPGVIPTADKATVTAGTVISYTPAEVDLLARLITAEAEIEPYQAKEAVGGAVVNRVQSKDWPNSISSVIYQVINGYYQFTPVKNGMIDKPASRDSIKAAWAALYGTDYSKGAQFYFDDSANNSFLRARTVTAQYGHMIFVK